MANYYKKNFEPYPAPPPSEGAWPERIKNATKVEFTDNQLILTTKDETFTAKSKNHKSTLLKMLKIRPGLCGKSCQSHQEVELLINRWKFILDY